MPHLGLLHWAAGYSHGVSWASTVKRGRSTGTPTKSAIFSWSKVEIRASDECWPWTGSVNKYGYGDCFWNGKRANASRAALESCLFFMFDLMQACHTCDNPICCNPSHLYEGTNKQNSKDRVDRGRLRGEFKAGSLHPRFSAKLSEDDVRNIRKRNSMGASQSSLAREYGVSSMQVSKICRRISWVDVK